MVSGLVDPLDQRVALPDTLGGSKQHIGGFSTSRAESINNLVAVHLVAQRLPVDFLQCSLDLTCPSPLHKAAGQADQGC